MHQRSKRSDKPIGHPFRVARTGATGIRLPPGAALPPDAEITPAAARLALEEAFAGPLPSHAASHPSSDDARRGDLAPPVVVVKRKRALRVAGEAEERPRQAADAAPAAPDDARRIEDRSPRVFRMAQTPHADPAGERATPLSPGPAAERVGGAASVEPSVSRRRPRRRAAPVVVTFVAQAVAHDDRRQHEKIERVARHAGHTADRLVQQLARLDSTLSTIRDAGNFRLANQEPPVENGRDSYRSLKSEMDELRAQVEMLRKAEAAEAVDWIRHAISAYGLTARDLGIR